MKTIKMKSTACGPAGRYQQGKTYEVDDDFAAGLLAGGYAEDVTPKDPPPPPAPEPKKKTAPIERAVIEPEDNAASPKSTRPRPRRRAKSKSR